MAINYGDYNSGSNYSLDSPELSLDDEKDDLSYEDEFSGVDFKSAERDKEERDLEFKNEHELDYNQREHNYSLQKDPVKNQKKEYDLEVEKDIRDREDKKSKNGNGDSKSILDRTKMQYNPETGDYQIMTEFGGMEFGIGSYGSSSGSRDTESRTRNGDKDKRTPESDKEREEKERNGNGNVVTTPYQPSGGGLGGLGQTITDVLFGKKEKEEEQPSEPRKSQTGTLINIGIIGLVIYAGYKLFVSG